MNGSARDVFAQNFKIIRIAHGLTMNDMALLLGFKQNSAIAQIEKGKRGTSIDILVGITSLFSVSLDWLLGFNNNIYNKELIERHELLIFSVPIGRGHLFFELVPEEYKDANKREEFYNIKERANIIYLVYYANFLSRIAPELQLNQDDSKSLIIKGYQFFESLQNINKKHFKTSEKEYEYAFNSLTERLNPDIRTYVDENNEFKHVENEMCLFDIEKEVQSLEAK